MTNSTVHDDDDDDCDNDGCTGNHDIRYLMFDTNTVTADDNGGIDCDNGGWH